MAAGASARVGEILVEAERYAHECEATADRVAEEAHRDAQAEAERVLSDARAEAEREARARADRIAAIQSMLAARGPALLEGLEGAGATRARLEELMAALAAAGERVVAAATEDGSQDPEPATEAEPEPEPDPVTVDDGSEDSSEATASSADATAVEDAEEETPAEPHPIVTLGASNGASSSGSAAKGEAVAGGDANGATAYDGPLPEGAPLARRPKRTRERDIRFNALLLALQGNEREDVEEQLCEEFGLDREDCARILDEVFGRPADTRA